MQDFAGVAKADLALTYLPVLLLAFICMVPFILLAEKQRKMKLVFTGAIAVLAVAQIGWALLPGSLAMLMICLWLFFTAFNILEASLPSMMSKLSPIKNKGTAMGIYSSAQFIGAFLGGILGGVIYSFGDISWIFWSAGLISAGWLIMMLPMQAPKHYSSRIVPLNEVTTETADEFVERLNAIKGVVEIVIVLEERIAYVKFLADDIDLHELEACLIYA